MSGAGGTDPYDLGPEGIARILADEPAFRRRQVEAWLTRGVDDPDEMTDLPVGLRRQLGQAFGPRPQEVHRTTADDGRTHKVLLRHGADGEAVESVLMLYPRGGGAAGAARRRHARATVCISTQAGCAMACPFCATGQAGFRRQLTFGETVRQVTVMQRLLTAGEVDVPGVDRADLPRRVTNVVFMGMGEPLANLQVTTDAVRWLAGRAGWSSGFDLSARAITVSTVGLVPGIRRLTELGLPITLAISLHAPNDALRDDLVPVNRQHPLAAVIAAARDYREATGRRLTFEYVLIADVNTELAHARELADLVTGTDAHVNLIPMNPTPAVPWRAPPVAHQRAFRDVLTARGVPATIRANRGGDIDAACGQLYADYAVGSGRMLSAATSAWERWPVRVGQPGGGA